MTNDTNAIGNIGDGATVAVGDGASANVNNTTDLNASERGAATGRDNLGTIITGDSNQININPTIRPPDYETIRPLHQLPAPVADFTGRVAELAKLRALVDGGTTILGVRGIGGGGKTQLVLQLADELQARYPDAQFFVNLQGASAKPLKPLSPAEALAHIVRAYHPTAKLPEGVAELQALYRSVLHDKRALVVLDDARDAAEVTPLLPPATRHTRSLHVRSNDNAFAR